MYVSNPLLIVFWTSFLRWNITSFVASLCSTPDAPKEIYFIGLVDVLTYYGVKKKTASAAKTVKYGAAEAENISTVRPDQYARRLVDFIAQRVLSDPAPVPVAENPAAGGPEKFMA